MDKASIIKKCCVVGGGPAGMMLGFLLARAGVEVAVLEKHPDFLRDFRGDTVHPSTLELMHELGLIDAFLALPHRTVDHFSVQIGDQRLRVVDLNHLPTHCKYVALMPQWDFLNFIAQQGRRYETFDLHTCTEATELIEESGHVVGIRARSPDGPLTVRADLVVACDGRDSTLRAESGLRCREYGAPMDVLWFRVARRDSDPPDTFGHIETGAAFVMLDRGDYWQCAYLIPKGGYDLVKETGIEALRSQVVMLSPFLSHRIGELKSFDDVKLLSVAVNRLLRWWRPGFLCIGDAAHAMSPIGGVGINVAVQDAVATANLLAAPLKANRLRSADLRAVQRRRALPARMTQRIQVAMQNLVIGPALGARKRPKAPLLFRLLDALPPLRRVPARLLAMGILPEHVRTPDVLAVPTQAQTSR